MKYKPYDAYKDSGIEWIGDIPAGWEVKKLKYNCTVNDETLPETTPVDYEMKYVDIGSVTFDQGIAGYQEMLFENSPSRARRIVKNGDVIVSTVRTYLKAIAGITEDKDVIVSTGFAVVRPINITANYLNYVVKNHYFVESVSANSVGVSYPAINASDMMSIKVAYPTNKDEQTAISNYLDTETAKIASIISAKHKLIEELQEKRSTIISHTVTKGLDPNAKMKPSGIAWIGDIPEGWEVKKLKYLSNTPLMYGANESPDSTDEEQPRYIRITDIDDNGNLRDDTFVSLNIEKAKPYLLKKFDILFARSGATVGKSYIYHGENEQACFAGYLIKLSLNVNKAIAKFIYYNTLSTGYKSWIEGNTIQATIQNVSAEKYNNFVVGLPPLLEQTAIVDYLDSETAKIDEIIAKTKASIERQNEYKTALISAYVTGKIDVRGE